jgi:hypothetical protein
MGSDAKEVMRRQIMLDVFAYSPMNSLLTLYVDNLGGSHSGVTGAEIPAYQVNKIYNTMRTVARL